MIFMHLHQSLRKRSLKQTFVTAMVRFVGQLRISVQPAAKGDFDGAEDLLERLDLPEEALENLCRLARLDEEPFRDQEGWSARVELDATPLLLAARNGRWAIYAQPGVDGAMLAARRLHGLIGATAEGWDLDR
jgi:hypothetical protein